MEAMGGCWNPCKSSISSSSVHSRWNSCRESSSSDGGFFSSISSRRHLHRQVRSLSLFSLYVYSFIGSMKFQICLVTSKVKKKLSKSAVLFDRNFKVFEVFATATRPQLCLSWPHLLYFSVIFPNFKERDETASYHCSVSVRTSLTHSTFPPIFEPLKISREGGSVWWQVSLLGIGCSTFTMLPFMCSVEWRNPSTVMELLHIRNWTWNTECLKNVKLLVYYLHRVELRIELNFIRSIYMLVYLHAIWFT